MKLQQRLKALERHSSPDSGPTMIVIQMVAPSPDGPGPGVAALVHVLGTRTQAGVSLRRGEDETEDAFLARAEVERFRIHGPEKYQPKDPQA